MSHHTHDDDKNQPDLASIKAPAAPSEAPDSQTLGEEQSWDKASKLAEVSPTKRNIVLRERMVERLEKENEALTSARDNLQTRLDDLRPKYAVLLQAKKNVTTSGLFGTIALALGGVSVSWAGSLRTDAWRYLLTGSGLALVAFGCILLFLMHLRGWPEDT